MDMRLEFNLNIQIQIQPQLERVLAAPVALRLLYLLLLLLHLPPARRSAVGQLVVFVLCCHVVVVVVGIVITVVVVVVVVVVVTVPAGAGTGTGTGTGVGTGATAALGFQLAARLALGLPLASLLLLLLLLLRHPLGLRLLAVLGRRRLRERRAVLCALAVFFLVRLGGGGVRGPGGVSLLVGCCVFLFFVFVVLVAGPAIVVVALVRVLRASFVVVLGLGSMGLVVGVVPAVVILGGGRLRLLRGFTMVCAAGPALLFLLPCALLLASTLRLFFYVSHACSYAYFVAGWVSYRWHGGMISSQVAISLPW